MSNSAASVVPQRRSRELFFDQGVIQMNATRSVNWRALVVFPAALSFQTLPAFADSWSEFERLCLWTVQSQSAVDLTGLAETERFSELTGLDLDAPSSEFSKAYALPSLAQPSFVAFSEDEAGRAATCSVWSTDDVSTADAAFDDWRASSLASGEGQRLPLILSIAVGATGTKSILLRTDDSSGVVVTATRFDESAEGSDKSYPLMVFLADRVSED